MNQTFTGKSFSCRILAMLLCVMMLFQSGVSFAQEAEAQNVPAAEASIVETVSTSNEDPEAETTAVDQSNTVSMLEEGLTPTKEPEFFSGTLVHEGADYTVTVEIGEDAQFPTDIRMRVQEILPGTPAYWLYLQAMGVVLAEDEELGEFSRLFDISFVQTVEEDGKEIILEPAAEISVQVTFHDPIVSDVENDVRAAHFDKLSPQIVEAETDSTDAAVNDDSAIDTVTFSSSTFSVYGFFQVKKVLKVLTLDGESYTYDVNVSYDNEKLSFPLDTTLVAREISESDPLYESYKEQAALALKAEADNVILAGLFDISILDKNGEKLELNDDVNVTISLEEDMTDKDVQVVHFKQDLEEVEQQTEEQNIAQNEIQTEVQNEHQTEDHTDAQPEAMVPLVETEVLEVSVDEEGAAQFKTGSFSVFALVYTVDFAYYPVKAEISIDLEKLQKAGNKLSQLIQNNNQGLEEMAVPGILDFAQNYQNDDKLCGEVYTLYLSNGTALSDFDADFFANAAVAIEGKGAEYGNGKITLTGDVENATVTFSTEKATLALTLTNYTAPEKPVVPDTEDGFAYRFFAESAAVAEIMESVGIVSSYYNNVSVSDTNLITVDEENDTLTVNNYFGEVVLTVELSDGTKVEIKLQNPAPVKAGETVVVEGVGSFAAAEEVPDGTKLVVKANLEAPEGITIGGAKKRGGPVESDPVFFEVSLVGPQGEKLETGADVTLHTDIKLPEAPEGQSVKVTGVKVYHIGEKGEAEELDKVSFALGEGTISSVSFATPGFSLFAVTYTVDFVVNGKAYTLPGFGRVLLSELLSALEINADLQDIADVSFTDESLLRLEKITENTTVYDLYLAQFGEAAGSDGSFVMEGDQGDSFNRPIQAGDWMITSLRSFETEETLTLALTSGEEIRITVTDPPEPGGNNNGQWSLDADIDENGIAGENATVASDAEGKALLTASVSSVIRNTPQERDVQFSVNIDYMIKDSVFQAMKDYVGGYPKLTYDLTAWLEDNPIDLLDGSGRIRAGNITVGNYEINNGVLTMTITNLHWLKTQNQLDGKFQLDVKVDEERLGTDDDWTFTLPGTDDPFTIHFKEQQYQTNKTVAFDGQESWDGVRLEKDADGYYYMNYTATINSPSKMDTLQFIDTLSSNQELVGDVTVTSPTGQNLTTIKTNTSAGFTVDISTTDNEGKLAAGTYTVTYRTKLTEAAVQQLESGNYQTDEPVSNDSDWKINGTKKVDGPSTEFQPKKDPPQPAPPEKKVNGQTGDVGQFTYNQILSYELTYGSEGISLQGTTISDRMSALQNLDGNVTIHYADGTTETMPRAPHGSDQGQGVVWNSPDQPQYTGPAEEEKTLFSYTFTEDREGPVTIKYTTKVLSESDAEALNLFGTKDVRNTFVVGDNSSWTVGHVETQQPTEIKKTIVNKNGTTEYKPDDIVTYTVEYGTAGQDMTGITLYDQMKDIQTINSPITITFGDGTTVTLNSGNSGYIWNDDNSYSTGMTDVLAYTVPEGMKGVITVTYDAKIISKDTANGVKLWGTQPLNNHASTSKGGSADTHKEVDFGEKPEPHVAKTAENQTAVNENRTEGNWQPGDVITWTITYTVDDGEDMRGMVLEDYLNNLQTYNNDATISINGGTPENMPDSYITYNQSQAYGSESQVYHFTVEGDGPVQSVVITYSTTIIDVDTALANSISGTKYVYNRAIGEDEQDEEGHDTDFPEIPQEKDVTAKDETESIDEKTWSAGQTVTYTLTYGAKGMKMNNAWLYDNMTDVQVPEYLSITVYYYADENGTDQRSFPMPMAAENNGSGVVYPGDDGQYSINNWVDLFNYTLPAEDSTYGPMYGPITIVYDATLIDAETATAQGIGGRVPVQNKFNTKVGADNTTGYVEYPSTSHDGKIQKTGYVSIVDGKPIYGVSKDNIPAGVVSSVSIADHQVTWYIRISAEDGSSYPLSNVSVQDDRGNFHQDISQGVGSNYYGDTPDVIDFYSAKIVSDSGVVLTPGEDYSFDSATNTWTFSELNEAVTIEVTATFPYELVGGYYMLNHVYLRYDNHQKEDYSEIEGSVSDIVVNKTGEYDPDTRIITWTVILNPSYRPYNPDISRVIFKDDLPEGLTMVNYNDPTSTENPSIFVEYLGKRVWNDYDQEISVSVSGNHFEAEVTPYKTEKVQVTKYVTVESYRGQLWKNWLAEGNYKGGYTDTTYDSNLQRNVVDKDTWINAEDIGEYDYIYETTGEYTIPVTVWNTQTIPAAGIDTQKYVITYKTIVDDDEWAMITSSGTGSKTYENKALFTDDETISWSGTGNETVYVENPLDKFEVQETNTPGQFERISELDGDEERYYWYQLEINPKGEQLNHSNGDGSLNPLKLTDYIDTKIDIIPTMIQILEVDGSTERDTSSDEDKPVATYNDDTRLLVITNLHDKTHYRIRYQVRVRAMYTLEMEDPESASYHEYIISNSATLEGGGSWSDTITGSHKTRKDANEMGGGIQLKKVDENNAIQTIPGAVFKLYEVKTGVELTLDANGNVVDIDTSNMLDDPEVVPVLDYTRNTMGEIIGEDNDGDGSNETYTSNTDGTVDFGKNLEPNTLYYWIETEFPEGYLGDTGKPHYFVIYYEEDEFGNLSSGIHGAWELDDIWSRKYGFKIASISDGTIWVANNSKTRSISITKNWEGDYSNTYKTRPEAITVNLIQVKEDGTRTVYATATLRADSNGNWLAYTNYSWTNLPPTYEEDGETKYYTYTVSESAVPGYFVTYSEEEPIKSGSITITNTLIPSKTNIFVEKVWKGDDPDARPAFIEVQLMQIVTDRDGNSGNPTVYGTPVKLMRGTDGKWTYEWTDLPTKDGLGGTYSYTVQEVSVPEGYAVTYSDNQTGILASTESAPLTITNTGLGSLQVTKAFAGISAGNLTADQLRSVLFTVKNAAGTTVASFSLYEMMPSLSRTIENLPVGSYTVTESGANGAAPEGYAFKQAIYSVENGATTVTKGQTSTVNVTNEYEQKKADIQVKKTFRGVENLPETFYISNDFNNLTFTVDGSGEEAPIYEASTHTYTWTLKDVPLGTKVTFTEAGITLDGYTVSVFANGIAVEGPVITATAAATSSEEGTAIASFYNVYETSTAELTVTKTVKLNGSTDTAHGGTDLTFYVGLFENATETTAISGTVKTITVASGSATGSVTYDGLTIGQQYYVFETDASGNKLSVDSKAQGYYVIANGGQSDAITLSPIVNVDVENEKRTGDLELTKRVAGDGADKNKQFEFTIMLNAPSGETLETTYPATHTGDSTIATATISEGTTTVLLKADEVYTITGLPEGTTYTITETDYSTDGYSASVTSTTYGLSGTIPRGDTAKASVEVTNTFSAGTLTVEKVLAGNATDNTKDFNFSVTFAKNGLTGNRGEYKKGTEETIANAVAQTITFSEGSATVTFTLKGGEKVEFSALPVGTTFTVSETSADQDGYETTVVTTGGTLGDNKTVTGSISATTSVTAEYTNTKNTTSIEATKQWKQNNAAIQWPEDVASVEFMLYKKIGEAEKTAVTRDDLTNYWTAEELANFTNPVVITSEASTLTAKWEKLPKKYLVEGAWVEAVYTVEETKVTYTNNTTLEGEDLTTTFNPQTTNNIITNHVGPTTYKVQKTWGEGQLPPEGAEIEIELGTITSPDSTDAPTPLNPPKVVTLNGGKEGGNDTTANPWEHEWTDLPKYNSEGKLIFYRAMETSYKIGQVAIDINGEMPPSYTSDETYQLIATNQLPTTSIKAKKNWANNATPPLNTTVKLAISATVSGGTAPVGVTISPTEVTLDGIVDTNEPICETIPWEYEWKDLPQYDKNGKLITYTVTETAYKIGEDEQPLAREDDSTTEGYQFSFTNTVPTRDIVVEKVWSPAGWPTDIQSVTVGLFQSINGADATPVTSGDPAVPETITFDGSSDEEERTFSDLPVYDSNGNLITYSVKEISVTSTNGSVISVTNGAVTVNGQTWTVSVGAVSDEGKATVTNTYTGISINVTKRWTQDGHDKSTVTSIGFTLHQVLTASGHNSIDAEYTAYGTSGAGTVNYITGTGWETVIIRNLPLTVTRMEGEEEITYAASYYVVETGATADAGYILTTMYSDGTTENADGSAVAMNTDGSTITIINTETAGVTLPSTGGPGTVLYTAAGLSLLLGASLWLMLRRRKEQQN